MSGKKSNQKPSKIHKGKLWRYREGYYLMPMSQENHILSPNEIVVTTYAALIETTQRNDALIFLPSNARKQCPLCSKKDCLNNPLEIDHHFNRSISGYGICTCVKTRKKFIIEKSINTDINGFTQCAFCTSPNIKRKTSILPYPKNLEVTIETEVNCNQCHISYTYNLEYEDFDSYDFDNKAYVPTHILYFGKYKDIRLIPKDYPLNKVDRTKKRIVIFSDDRKSTDMVSYLNKKFKDLEYQERIIINMEPVGNVSNS